MKVSFLFALIILPMLASAQVILQYDSLINDSFFRQDIAVYPWWIAIDDSGKAASIFEEQVNLDSPENRKRVATSKCVSYYATDSTQRYTSYYYDSRARISGDTLFLKFVYQAPPHYEIWMAEIYKGKIHSSHESSPPEMAFKSKSEREYYDSVEALNPFLEERLVLNKRQYQKGELLLAKIFLLENGKYGFRYEGVLKFRVE